MAGPEDIVTEFLSTWTRPGGFAEGVHAAFTPDTVWENVGMSRTVGPEQAIALFEAMGGQVGPMVMRVDTLSMATCGNTVLTERVDHILGPDGTPALSFPVMGAFDVCDGRIVAWRDYFDTAGFVGGAAQGGAAA